MSNKPMTKEQEELNKAIEEAANQWYATQPVRTPMKRCFLTGALTALTTESIYSKAWLVSVKDASKIFDTVYDLTEVSDDEKGRHVNDTIEIVAKPLLHTFFMLGLQEHISGVVENDGEYYEITFKKLPAPPKQ